MERANDGKFKDDEKFTVEDFTGCIPLLLDKCVVKGKIDLDSPYFEAIGNSIAGFEFEMQDTLSRLQLERYDVLILLTHLC